MTGATPIIARAERGEISTRAAGTSAPGSSGASRWRSFADTALSAVAPLWLLAAAILAATMGTWPPHIYL